MSAKIFPMIAKTFKGLEDVLRDELIALGAQNVELGNRMVSFEGDQKMLYRANLCCRTALRILKPIEKFMAADPDDLYSAVRDIDWSRYMTPDTTLSIDSTVNSEDFKHSKYVTYRVKDGITDYFRDRSGKRPSICLHGADLQLDVHISDNRVTLSLNSSGESLSQRGYRVAATPAPINEVLAAGILLKTGWRGDTQLLDPMCGSGTFLIEAALIAANINPGVFRSGFAFEKWPDFDAELFESLYNDDSAERDPAFPIIGADIDPEAVAITKKNIHEARLDKYIAVSVKDFTTVTESPEGEPGIIVTNPPYGERLVPENLGELFAKTGTVLKRHFSGWHVWILGYHDEAFAGIGLKPSVKFPINNGGLECTLREYVLFDGSYRGFRTDGGSVSNTTFNREIHPKIKHVNDKQWRKEARRFTPDRLTENGRRSDDNKKDFKRGNRHFREDRQTGFDKERRFRKDTPREIGQERFTPRGNNRFNKKARLGKGPRLSADSEIRLTPPVMRPRKIWRKPADTPDNDD